ncbi:MAG: hypothetical protein JNM26_03365 [Ideonella sp.]|nr:hypothetical protein [Ideonella sp.]
MPLDELDATRRDATRRLARRAATESGFWRLPLLALMLTAAAAGAALLLADLFPAI